MTCTHTARGSRCALDAGHAGLHVFRCAGAHCSGHHTAQEGGGMAQVYCAISEPEVERLSRMFLASMGFRPRRRAS